jgi:hypothetical protein
MGILAPFINSRRHDEGADGKASMPAKSSNVVATPSLHTRSHAGESSNGVATRSNGVATRSNGVATRSNGVATETNGNHIDITAVSPESSKSSDCSSPSEGENSVPIKLTVKDKIYIIDIPTDGGIPPHPWPAENENPLTPAATPATPATLAAAPTQREADRRNADAARSGSTDRWCSCGRLATFAWPDGRGRDVWRCLDCAPVRGKA